MRTKLVFPPRTGPTYTPLGAAYLYSVANRAGIDIGFFDANVELWNHICNTDQRFNLMRNFCHAPMDLFLQQSNYEFHFQHMPAVKNRIDVLEHKAKIYLEKSELDDELATFLLRHSIQIGFGSPESVAFSVMYPDQLAFSLAQAKYLNEVCGYDGDIVIGGAAMSALDPVEVLEAFLFIDAIFSGEGEVAFKLFLEGCEYSLIPGCHYHENGTIEFSGRPQYVKVLENIAVPDFNHFELYQYFNPLPVMPILGSRGCKWRRCSFCSHNSSFGPHRGRYTMAVVQEMMQLKTQFGCRHFYFADQYVDPDFLNDLSDVIIASGLDCRFHIMARTIKEYTPQLLNKAATAGCCWISWGMESGSQRLLDIMNKGTDVATSAEVIKAANAAGISNLLMMIFGAPGTDQACLEETFTFLDRIYGDIDSMTASAFVLFDNTSFSRNAAKYDLQILGQSEIFNVNGNVVHGSKLCFKRAGEYGMFESPLAALEIEMWERRKVWLGPPSFLGKLCCEHYLLYADAIKTGNRPKTLKKGA